MTNIALELAQHLDDTCGLGTTGGIASFFNEDGSLRPCSPGENIFAFNIACNLNIYSPDEHADYIQNVWNNLQGDISALNAVQNAVNSFVMPELDMSELVDVYDGTPTIEDLLGDLTEADESRNISVYDAQADEYYTASLSRAGNGNDVLDPGHLVFVIKRS